MTTTNTAQAARANKAIAAQVKEADTTTTIAPANKALAALAAMALGKEVDTINLAMTRATVNKGPAAIALAAMATVKAAATTMTPLAEDNKLTAAANPEDMVAPLVDIISTVEINPVATEALEVINMALVGDLASMVPLERAADTVALEEMMIPMEATEELVDMVALEKMTPMKVVEDLVDMAPKKSREVDMVALVEMTPMKVVEDLVVDMAPRGHQVDTAANNKAVGTVGMTAIID